MTMPIAYAGSASRGPWALILAGGEGVRLRRLTAAIAGDERPKQFCAVLGRRTLLDHTRARVSLVADPARTLIVLTRAHEPYYAPLLHRVPPGRLVVQPRARGTAPAILYALLRVAAADPLGDVVVLPSDHWVSDDARFMAHVHEAFATIARRHDLVVLLGMAPDRPETGYGWIEPGDAIPRTAARRVVRFCEKPAPHVVARLLERGALWNAFVLAGRVHALLALIRAAVPDLTGAFHPVTRVAATPAEAAAVDTVYATLPAVDFSDAVLAPSAGSLAVLPVTGVDWSDWGEPRRVLATVSRLGLRPPWAAAAGALA